MNMGYKRTTIHISCLENSFEKAELHKAGIPSGEPSAATIKSTKKMQLGMDVRKISETVSTI